MAGACTHFHIERLDDGAAAFSPESLQFEDDLLEGEHDIFGKRNTLKSGILLF